MTPDLKPKSNGNRARPLTKFERGLTLCTQPTCIKSGAWLIGDAPYCGHHAGAAALDTLEQEPAEPFGYWVEQKHAEPALLRKPAYIPEPSELRTVTPLYRRKD